MQLQEAIHRRHMVRSFTEQPVPAEVLERVLENALHAPSAGFSQGWAFVVLEGREQTDRFWAATTDPAAEPTRWLTGMRRAPVVVVALSCKRAYLERYAEPDKGWTDRDEARWPVPYWHVDTGMAALLMLLTAVDEGLGACFFGVPPEHIPTLRTALGIPEDHHPVGAVALGYPAPDVRSPSLRRGRRTLDEVVHRGGW